MYQWKRIWRGYALALGVLVLAAAATFVVPGMTRSAEAATKTVWIPSRWQSTGEVPWVQSRTKESANFILLWGDRSGTDPRNAPGEARFDPDNVLSQLETLYN